MPIDLSLYPDIPVGAKLQPTADPNVFYVFIQDVDADGAVKRSEVGIIRKGVFTVNSQFKRAKPIKDLTHRFNALSKADAVHPVTKDLFDNVEVEEKETPLSFSSLSVSLILTAAYFSTLSGKVTEADISRFVENNRHFLSGLTAKDESFIAENPHPEAIRRLLMTLEPAHFSELVQKLLLEEIDTALSTPNKSPCSLDLPFDATHNLLTITTDANAPSLTTGFSYKGALVATRASLAAKPLTKMALTKGADWVLEISGPEGDCADLYAHILERFESIAQSAQMSWQTEEVTATLFTTSLLNKGAQKAFAGLTDGCVIKVTRANSTRFFITSLPATLAAARRLLSTLTTFHSDSALLHVYFPLLGASNAQALLNKVVLLKLTQAVRRNETRRRKLEGLPALTPSAMNQLFLDPVAALKSTAAFLTLV